MFVRKKRNKSGSVSVQIIKKENGKNRVVESIGCSKDKKTDRKTFRNCQGENKRVRTKSI